jgi:hypothetical protein
MATDTLRWLMIDTGQKVCTLVILWRYTLYHSNYNNNNVVATATVLCTISGAIPKHRLKYNSIIYKI